MAESEPRRKPNRLINEKSPYLQEHAFNLVDWYPWGEEALARAKNDGKPILLSIGYSTCHWCHVLARESFDDASTAALINKNFIPIKVDREERPELDAFYMSSVQTLTGQGGWPLTVFLTPDLKPFYGGTYFPPEPRYGMPSFKQVLTYVSALWKEKREEVVGRGSEVVAAVQERYRPEARGELRQATLDDAYDALVSAFDDRNGGFGGSPKFPLPSYLSFLLRYHYRTKKPLALSTVTRTLDAIDRGGIHDHLGGGFHRYATDRIWLVPHFEKMLYDNALLATAYTEAALATGELGRAQPARDALGWMLREMRAPEGGFYSAQDADTKDGEGVFYTWRPEEVSAVIG
ncbi:MAG TPA: thioredoxin domain-containing protein, partial [Nitrososphaerales archaeon]|nr:thioredoxin domain-containing protein [Nitrososphaerales archaeon]